ncbi:GDP-mannose transporter GONST1-like [Macadamia integrifolia]|uniref:GDP-mannose transporter GONST1-like n=1 Tax=Macadamia integrifolia TaxID=60698 RepID=UPI001C52F34E|nr:GDP-mannose transporter GONST1-like [Macadamia integrifolia]
MLAWLAAVECQEGRSDPACSCSACQHHWGTHQKVWTKRPLLRMPMFWIVITSSGFLGLAISFTSMWFLHQTGATTYSLVGSLNKIPLSIAGILLFNVPTSPENFASILFGLLAGVFFTKAKMWERSQS